MTKSGKASAYMILAQNALLTVQQVIDTLNNFYWDKDHDYLESNLKFP